MQTVSLVNMVYASSQNPTPTVDMGATLCLWTDRRAATVIAVSQNGKTVTVQEDKATRKDHNGMSDSQTYTYQADPTATKQVFSLRQNGRWVSKGSPMTSGTVLVLGTRDKFHDYSF